MYNSVVPAPALREGRGGIQHYKLLAGPLIVASLSLLLSFVPASAATGAANQNSGVSPAGDDILKFLGATAEKSGLVSNASADTTDVYDIIAAIINTVLGLTGIIFFIMVFWAGFRWMTAGGAEETITTAKKTIVSSVIGIAIALSAFVLTNFVLNKIEEINKGGGTAPASTATDSASQETYGKCEGGHDSQNQPYPCLFNKKAACEDVGGNWTANVQCVNNGVSDQALPDGACKWPKALAPGETGPPPLMCIITKQAACTGRNNTWTEEGTCD